MPSFDMIWFERVVLWPAIKDLNIAIDVCGFAQDFYSINSAGACHAKRLYAESQIRVDDAWNLLVS
jgi:hypothetical protein